MPNKLIFIKNCVHSIIKGMIIGLKSILLLYIGFIIECIGSDVVFLLIFCFLGLLNGFIDAHITIKINNILGKIFSCIFGIITTIFLLILSLYLSLPNILVDYFIYGEGGGGLEPGGWFAFNFYILFYFGSSVLLGFPISMILLTNGARSRPCAL